MTFKEGKNEDRYISVQVGLLLLLVTLVFTGCSTCEKGLTQRFTMPNDGFSFTNQLKWAYQWDAQGKMHAEPEDPPPTFIHHCFPMARAAREFFYHAKFEPVNSRLGESQYRDLVNQVVQRDSRCPSGTANRIVIPGFPNLHEFSAAYPEILEKGCGSAKNSYFQRGNWRMLFPFSRAGQTKQVKELSKKLQAGILPIVHVVNFPTHTINHAILLTAVEEDSQGYKFQAYDPNNPAGSATLTFDFAEQRFHFERNRYFAGGPVNIYEVYRNLLF
jgi:hypothetical protein